MSITFKQLAEICGVSRATVDRVINNRGKVAPEVEQRIRTAAEQYGFKPNQVGRALALVRNPIKIGVLVHLTRIDFFQELLKGVYAGQKEVGILGGQVIIKEQEDFDAERQIHLLNELVAEGVNGIALSPTQSGQLRERLDQLSQSGIPIVTFNTELDGFEKLCHVGVDNIQGGRIGAYIMSLLLNGQGGKVLIISGYENQQSNFLRLDGFTSECAMRYSNIKTAGIEMNKDDERQSYEITKEAIRKNPDLAGIYMISNGLGGTCRALEECGLADKIKLIGYDLLPVTEEYLKKGVIDFVIDQDAHGQGSIPANLLFDYLFSGKKPKSDRMIGRFGLTTSYNL